MESFDKPYLEHLYDSTPSYHHHPTNQRIQRRELYKWQSPGILDNMRKVTIIQNVESYNYPKETRQEGCGHTCCCRTIRNVV